MLITENELKKIIRKILFESPYEEIDEEEFDDLPISGDGPTLSQYREKNAPSISRVGTVYIDGEKVKVSDTVDKLDLSIWKLGSTAQLRAKQSNSDFADLRGHAWLSNPDITTVSLEVFCNTINDVAPHLQDNCSLHYKKFKADYDKPSVGWEIPRRLILSLGDETELDVNNKDDLDKVSNSLTRHYFPGRFERYMKRINQSAKEQDINPDAKFLPFFRKMDSSFDVDSFVGEKGAAFFDVTSKAYHDKVMQKVEADFLVMNLVFIKTCKISSLGKTKNIFYDLSGKKLHVDDTDGNRFGKPLKNNDKINVYVNKDSSLIINHHPRSKLKDTEISRIKMDVAKICGAPSPKVKRPDSGRPQFGPLCDEPYAKNSPICDYCEQPENKIHPLYKVFCDDLEDPYNPDWADFCDVHPDHPLCIKYDNRSILMQYDEDDLDDLIINYNWQPPGSIDFCDKFPEDDRCKKITP